MEETYVGRPRDLIEMITIWDKRDKAVGSYIGARSVTKLVQNSL